MRLNQTDSEGKIVRPLNSWKATCIVLLFCAAAASLSAAQTFTTLDTFAVGTFAKPQSPLVQSIDGNLYGEAGNILRITPSGTLTQVNKCSFGLGSCVGGLVQSPNLDLYGTSSGAGTFNCGTLFQITPNGTAFVLHDFACGYDGDGPQGGLAHSDNGNFYGVTNKGGGFSYGTIFEATPSGTVTTLNEFHGPDGEYPYGGLAVGADGNLYGTTAMGGANGYGTFFKITPAGVLTVLHDFEGIDGASPQATLVQASNGNFYGTATYGGVNYTCLEGCGTVFEATPAGEVTVLHSFDGTDGSAPQSALVLATDGNLYGTAAGPMNFNCTTPLGECGTIFQITTAGAFTLLHSFSGSDGANPVGGLMQATNGTLYGTTVFGSTGGSCQNVCPGTVYSLSMGLGPFVAAVPPRDPVGRSLIILGSDLTGATSVSFNGTPATFTVVSATEIKTSVPTGATTGTLEVTTPRGTLSSNVIFRVP
jgi:uncharacterized repeat protein (TIGR03803 family)